MKNVLCFLNFIRVILLLLLLLLSLYLQGVAYENCYTEWVQIFIVGIDGPKGEPGDNAPDGLLGLVGEY